ncbi:hypothetical protein CRM22_009191 [Opisthorchis felineus]|uniref:Uncharacterized protein n=1 Tax=Opisthorchis felineus TaxID=147828 RepID=A0A4S2L9X4_OPIFE|nr:hypothetical protein CRM22_009191 [Opisthorchis felineus]
MLSKQFVIHQGLYHLRRGVHSLMFPGVDYGTRACLQDCSPQKKHVKALHKYKKVIQEAIQQGILGEDTTLLQVTDVSPGDRPNLYEVRCALPCLVTGDALSQARALELAVELECKVNGSSTDFRTKKSIAHHHQQLPLLEVAHGVAHLPPWFAVLNRTTSMVFREMSYCRRFGLRVNGMS